MFRLDMVCCCLVMVYILSTMGFTLILRALLEATDLWLTWQGQLLRKRRQSSWLLLYSKWVGLFYVRLGGGFKSVLMFISIWAWYAAWLIFLNWVVQPPPRKLVDWYHQRKIGFHDNGFCFRTPTSGCKSTSTLRWLEAKSCELYQSNLHGWSNRFHQFFRAYKKFLYLFKQICFFKPPTPKKRVVVWQWEYS